MFLPGILSVLPVKHAASKKSLSDYPVGRTERADFPCDVRTYSTENVHGEAAERRDGQAKCQYVFCLNISTILRNYENC